MVQAAPDFSAVLDGLAAGERPERPRAIDRFVALDQLDPALAKAVRALDVGEVSRPIQVKGAFMVVELEAEWPAGKLPLDVVRDAIAQSVHHHVEREVWQLVEESLGAYEVEWLLPTPPGMADDKKG